jgi:quercetin dioxygenase-like cupin family protein
MGVVRRREEGWRWAGIDPRDYASGAARHVLIGPEDGATEVELRYFELPPGGASALERHPHEHAVLILHGEADVLLGDEVHPAGPGDAVFVAGGELHQLRAGPEAPLGFLCAVRADRGRPPAPGR